MKTRSLTEIWNQASKQEAGAVGVMDLQDREPFLVLNCENGPQGLRFETFSDKHGIFYLSDSEARRLSWLEWPEAARILKH